MPSTLRNPFDILLGAIDEIITAWRHEVRPEPWADLPPARLLDSLPEILPRLIRLARARAPQIDDDLRERIALEHGTSRREDAIPAGAVADEWHAVRRACADVLAMNGAPMDADDTQLATLDVLIDDAIGYTLRGYYRPELDSLRGRGLDRRETPAPDRRQNDGNRRRG